MSRTGSATCSPASCVPVHNRRTRRSLFPALLVVVAQLAFGVGGAHAETFGSTAIGSGSAVPGAGYKFGSIYRLPQSGTTASFSWYARGGNALQRLTPVIYRVDSLGMPSSLVVKGSEVTIGANQAPGWVTSTLPATSLTAGDYLLGLMSGPNGSMAAVYYHVAFNAGFWNANTYGAPSSTWGQINREGLAWAFYVTYTPAVAGPAPTNSVPPTITGTTTAGRELAASAGTWTGSPTDYAYQWQRCNSAGGACVNVAGATASTYTLAAADVGSTMRAAVTATNAGGSATATSAATAVVVPSPPANSSPPVISGTAANGEVLSASTGTWSGSPTGYEYRWQRCDSGGGACASIFDATGSSYRLGDADVGSSMRVVVTATNAGGSAQATSDASRVVAEAPSAPSNTAPPTISGTAMAGQTLTAELGTWNGEPPPALSGQWQRCESAGCTDIAGATDRTYKVVDGDVGKTLRIAVAATNTGGTARETSAPTATVTAAPSAETAVFGNTVPGAVGDLPGDGYKIGSIFRLADEATLVDFRFYARGGTSNQSFVPAIYATNGGTPSTLITKAPAVTVSAGSAAAWRTAVLPSGVTLQPGDFMLALVPGPNHQGAYIYNDVGSSTSGWWNYNGYPNPSATWGTIRTEAKRWSFHVNYLTDASVAPPVNQTAPTISGSTYVGQRLSATTGTWANNPTSYDHQWKRCQDGTCTPISGATSGSYVSTAADEGSSLMVVVGATNRSGRTEASSARTAPITAPSGFAIQPFTAFTIDPNPIGSVIEKTLADLDGDGRLDAVIGMQWSPSQGGSGGIHWYQQPATGNLADPWVKRTILPSGKAYEDMAPMDVSGDGHMDIVASVDNRIWWFRNPGPGGGGWQQNLIGEGYRENTMRIGDLDGDGKRDIVTNSAMFFQNGPNSWTSVPYNKTHGGIDLLDVGSGMGAINLVASGPAQDSIVWFENPRERGGNARTGTWTRRTIGPGYICPGGIAACPEGAVATMAVAEINGDGRMDVFTGRAEDEPAEGGLRWFEAPADRTGPWTMHDIQTTYQNTHNLGVGDIDGNGAMDLVAGEQDQSPQRRIGVFYNNGNGFFTEQVLATEASHNVVVGDVEADGDLDILTGPHGWYGAPHPVRLFRNERFGGGTAPGATF